MNGIIFNIFLCLFITICLQSINKLITKYYYKKYKKISDGKSISIIHDFHQKCLGFEIDFKWLFMIIITQKLQEPLLYLEIKSFI